MTVTIDTNILLFLLNDKTPAPIDPKTGIATDKCSERVDYLIATLAKSKEQIIIPTPVLSEALVHAPDAAPTYLNLIQKQKYLRLADFNQLAAIETSCMLADAYRSGVKQVDGEPRSKFKFDTMIFAIAKLSDSRIIYSNDRGIKKLGQRYCIDVLGIEELPLPPEPKQMDIFG